MGQALRRQEREIKKKISSGEIKFVLRPGETTWMAYKRQQGQPIGISERQAEYLLQTSQAKAKAQDPSLTISPTKAQQQPQTRQKTQTITVQQATSKNALLSSTPRESSKQLVAQSPFINQRTQQMFAGAFVTPQMGMSIAPYEKIKQKQFKSLTFKEQATLIRENERGTNFNIPFTSISIGEKARSGEIKVRAAGAFIGAKSKEFFSPIKNSKAYQKLFGTVEIKEAELYIGRGQNVSDTFVNYGTTKRESVGIIAKANTFTSEKIAKPTIKLLTGGSKPYLESAESLNKSDPTLAFARGYVGGALKFAEEKPLLTAATFGGGALVGVGVKALAPFKTTTSVVSGLGTVGEGVLISSTAFAVATAPTPSEAGRRFGAITVPVASAYGGFKFGANSQLAANLQSKVVRGIEYRQSNKIFKQFQQSRGTFEIEKPQITESGSIRSGFRPIDAKMAIRSGKPEFAVSGEIQSQLIPKKFDPLGDFLAKHTVKPDLGISADPLFRASYNPSQTTLTGIKVLDFNPKTMFVKIVNTGKPTTFIDLIGTSTPPKGGLMTSINTQVAISDRAFKIYPKQFKLIDTAIDTSSFAKATTFNVPERVVGIAGFGSFISSYSSPPTIKIGSIKPIVAPIPKVLSPTKTEIIQISEPKPITVPDVVYKTKTRTTTITIPKFPSTPSTPTIPSTPFTPSTTPPSIAPQITSGLPFGGYTFPEFKGRIGKTKTYKLRFKRQNTPTLYSAGLNIYGKRTRIGVKSGLGLRLLQKKKKKKKLRGFINI